MKKAKNTKAGGTGSWLAWAVAGAAAVIAWIVYQPALGGDFVFDDRYLPIFGPKASAAPLSAWIGPIRPVLMINYWLNLHLMQWHNH